APTASSTSCGRRRSRFRVKPGRRNISPRTRARSRTGNFPGFARAAPRRPSRPTNSNRRFGSALGRGPIRLVFHRGVQAMIRRLRLIVVALVALTFAGPMAFAAADDAKLSASVQQLGADDFDAKIAAVGELAATPDPRVIKILKALEDGELYVAKDKKVVRAEPDGDSFTIFEPL